SIEHEVNRMSTGRVVCQRPLAPLPGALGLNTRNACASELMERMCFRVAADIFPAHNPVIDVIDDVVSGPADTCVILLPAQTARIASFMAAIEFVARLEIGLQYLGSRREIAILDPAPNRPILEHVSMLLHCGINNFHPGMLVGW